LVAKLNPDLITDDMMYEKVDIRTFDGRPLHDHLMDSKLWGEIHRAAKTNKALQAALDHAIMIYKLSKEYKDGV
jgi:hypothetical protein